MKANEVRSIRLFLFIFLSLVIFLTTTYSVAYDTYLDTSNPFRSKTLHPLSETHYFANKQNPLNVYFIKQAWAWTSAVFVFLWFMSPATGRVLERWTKWATITLVWYGLTTWFFGPSIMERVAVASGGECILTLPSGDPMILPVQLCLTRSLVPPYGRPYIFNEQYFSSSAEYTAVPKLQRGHDVSGHIFLLTLSTLFLADQLQYSIKIDSKQRSTSHRIAMFSGFLVTLISIFSAYTTSLYFHTPSEKFTGYVLGVAGFSLSILPELFQRFLGYKIRID